MKPKKSDPGCTRREFLILGASGVATVSLSCNEGTGLIDLCGQADSNNPHVLEPTCGDATVPSIEGPYFITGSPERSVLRQPAVEGLLLSVSGQVLSPCCTPIPDALLDFWHADDDGDYDNLGFTLRGHQFSDLDGRYQLDTIVPGRYLNGESYRPAHIHVKVSAPGFKLLTTQLYFAGDPSNDTDTLIKRQLIMTPKENADGSKEAVFDFVLAPDKS